MDDTTLSSVALADDGTRLVGSAELFRRLNERLPGWYAKRYLTTAEAARVLGVKLKKYRLRKHGSTQDHRQAL